MVFRPLHVCAEGHDEREILLEQLEQLFLLNGIVSLHGDQVARKEREKVVLQVFQAAELEL